ncbi:MAG: ATP synthase subunit I [Firmicutes bacterium]|nr:ATP synthase subunit I [Bacillota bacterium]
MQWLTTLLSFPWGVLLGFLYFGGLWWTVTKLTTTRSTALLFIVSFMVRMTVVMVSFYFLLMKGLPNLLAALVGFLVARMWSINSKKAQKQVAGDNHPKGEY